MIRRRLAVLALLSPVIACGGGDGGVTPPPATPTISAVAIAPRTVALTGIGTASQVTASVTMSDGSTLSSPTISWTSRSPGVASVAGSNGTAVVTSVAAGTATIVATAGTRSDSIEVTVTPAQQTLSVTIAGMGTVTSNPAGIVCTTGTCTASFAFNTPVTLTATPSAGTVFDAWGGACTGSTTCSVTMNAARTVNALFKTAATSITWNFCAYSGIPLWLAVQDGSGAWTRVTSPSLTDYTFSLREPRGGVAYVFFGAPTFGLGTWPLTYVSTFYGTVAEIVAHGRELCAGANGGFVNQTVALQGVGANDFVIGGMGRSDGFTPIGASTVPFYGVQGTIAGGLTDLFLTKANLSGTVAVMRRGISASATPAPVDFASSEAFPTVTRNLTINNLGNDLAYLFGSYQTANNAYGVYFIYPTPLALSTLPWPGIPTNRQQAGDAHILRLSAAAPGDTTNTRYAYAVVRDAVDVTVTLGPTLSAPTLNVVRGSASVGLALSLPVQSAYDRFYNANAIQLGRGLFHLMQRTAAYDAVGSSVTLTIPDFQSVEGFLPAWTLAAGLQTFWSVGGSSWNGQGPASPPYDLLHTSPYVSGTTYLSATRGGVVVP